MYLLVIGVSLSVGCAGTDPAHKQQTIIFGPETFSRGAGEPQRVVKNFSLNSPLQDFTISVQSGEGRHGRASSAIVELNGTQVIGPNDFSKQVDLITKPASLVQGHNTLALELRSEAGTSVIVTILGRFPSVNQTVPHTGGSVNLNGLALVTFPKGAFSGAQTVTVTATNSPAVHEDFSATAEGPRLPYEIRIKLGNVPPSTPFDVILNVPQSFVTSLPQNYQLEIFAQPIEFSKTETLGHFNGYASTFDSATNTLRATVPPTAFNDDAPDETFEAILIVGAIPKYQRRNVGAQGSSSGSSSRSDTDTGARRDGQ
ncbi:MAG TPA: hypothetical protein VGR30_07485 [Candidatus Binatia bacterium]|jgi:hypothetical protein|nr:hypothetical protein [Candidatus Binatia bacterium]